MAVTVKAEYVITQMRELNSPYFSISPDGGRSVLAENQKSADVEEAIQRVQECFENIEDSAVYIKIADKPKKERGNGGSWNCVEFRVKFSKQKDGISGIDGTVRQLLEQNNQLQLKMIELINNHQRELMQIKFDRQIEELKKENEENPLIKQAIGQLPNIISIFSGKQPIAVAGTNDEPIESNVETVAGTHDKIRKALQKLSTVDKSLADTLTLLAEYAVKNPDQYRAFIPMLKGQL